MRGGTGAWIAALIIAGGMSGTAGCIPALPENIWAGPPQRSIVAQDDTAIFSAEDGLDDALWLEIPSTDGNRMVGGYLSQDPASRRSLVILLHGASTFVTGGSTTAARLFHASNGPPFRQAGYRTLSLDFRECGTAYGQGDVEDLVVVVDWLNARGKALLDIDHVYTFGYSVGATTAILASRQRQVTAVASISGVTQPKQFEDAWHLYYLLGLLYAANEGLCQLGTTLATYGPPGSPAWDVLDTVGQISELTSPLLIIQGTQDQIYSTENAWSLDAAYQEALTSGVRVPPIEFLYLEGADHFAPLDDPRTLETILAFFEQFGG